MTEKKGTKIFISYSWSSQDKALNLAERLVENGIDTVMDIWDLKPGNDKYAFMESMITDSTIDYVLILCDKKYVEKANDRSGGVGDETIIISSELYGKTIQTKFIPIVLETDESGVPYKPLYITSRIHFDLSNKDMFEDEYIRLLRTLHNEPEYQKPKLGNKPEYLSAQSISVSGLKTVVSQMNNAKEEKRQNAIVKQFPQQFIDKAKEYIVDISNTENEILEHAIISKIDEMKPLRDVYLDFLNEVILVEKNSVDFICKFFEEIYNKLLFVERTTENQSQRSGTEVSYEHYKFLIWECFICTMIYLRHYEKYAEINTILTHTFFLQENIQSSGEIKPHSFNKFRGPLEFLNNQYGKSKKLLSLPADLAIKRQTKPLVDKNSFSETDVFLTQMAFALRTSKNDYPWFAHSYVYTDNVQNFWIKLCSKEFCTKILPLFNVTTIAELKLVIENNPVEANFGYRDAWNCIPPIPLDWSDCAFASLP